MHRTAPSDFEDYLRRYPPKLQRLLRQMRSTIKRAAPRASEKISYGIPTFYLDGNLVYFAAFKNHIGFYPTASPIRAFSQELTPYKHSRGAVQFPLDQPLPLALVARMVKFRLQERVSKKAEAPRKSRKSA